MEQHNKFDVLPNETLLHIFSFFNKRDQGRTSLVSKHFQELAKDDSLKTLPYPDLDYSEVLPAKTKSLTVNLPAGRSNGGIWSMTVLSDQHFVTATGNGLLKVWDKDKVEPIRQFNKHAQHRFKTIWKVIPISSTRFISCGEQGTVYLWDIKQAEMKDQDLAYWNEPLVEFKGHSTVNTVYEAEFLKESNLLLTGGSDKKLRIWNIQTGECLHKVVAHTQNVGFIATFANNLIVSASNNSSAINENAYDYDIKLWRLEPNAQLTLLSTLTGHTEKIVAFCKLNNKLLATGSEDGTIRIWDIEESICVKTINLPELKQPECLKLIALGYLACGTLVEGTEEDCIYLYDVKDLHFTLVKTLTGHEHGLVGRNSLLDLGNGYFASADSMYGTIKLWHVERDNCLQTIQSSGDIRELAKLPNGYLISGRFDKGGLNIWAFPEREFKLISTPKP